MARPTLITTALPYANGSIHLGFLLEAIQTDVFARALRMEGEEVVFVSADDTHGTPIELNARKEGVTPEAFVERFAKEHVEDLAAFGVEFDAFHSTNSEENRRWAEEIYGKLKERGVVERRNTEQLFDPKAGRFLPDRFVKGTCPVCKTPDQYGDVCENCKSTYEPTQLIDPYSAISGARPEIRESEHLFVKLDAFEAFLRDWTSTPGRLQPEVKNFVDSWLENGLQDWCISRDGPYFGFEIPDAPGKFFYVWLDAPIGYISATEAWAQRSGIERLSQIWRQKDARVIHVIGKDIIYFHTLFWPAMLQAAELKVPDHVHAHGMLMVDGVKMSKSRGTFLLARTFREHLEPEILRWYFGSKLGPGIDDIDLSLDELVQRVNAEMVNNLVNLVSRGASFLKNKLDGRYSELPDAFAPFRAEAEAATARARRAYAEWNPAVAVRAALDLADAGNRLFQERTPWTVAKTDPDEARRIVTMASNLARAAAVLIAPVVPRLATRIYGVLGLEGAPERFDEALRFDLVERPVGNPVRLAERIDRKTVDRMIEATRKAHGAVGPGEGSKSSKASEKGATAPADGSKTSRITIDDLDKIDLRVGVVVEAGSVEGADKLLQLRVDVGEAEPRTIFAGIAKAYPEPATLVGRRVVVVANLAPRKMRFGTSEGMVLAAGPGGTDIQLLSVDQGALPGSIVK